MTTTSTTTATKRTKQKKTVTGPLISADDVAEHVSHMYMHGPGGILREKAKRTERVSTTTTAAKNPYHVLDRHPTLVLNANYQPLSHLPLSIWHWQEAIKAVFSGKVTVVDVYPGMFIRAARLEIPLPAVIALNEYVPQFTAKPAFTKRNVFLRDEYRCQYCGHRFHTRDLSLDHVVPRSHGGPLNWENAVTCCHSCNTRKGSLRVDQLPGVGMRLQRSPDVPTQYELAAIAGKMLPRLVDPTWKPFLGMSFEDEDDATMGSVDSSANENYLQQDDVRETQFP
jgi:5-methylcytosine-specific restriction endonuclease McrA